MDSVKAPGNTTKWVRSADQDQNVILGPNRTRIRICKKSGTGSNIFDTNGTKKKSEPSKNCKTSDNTGPTNIGSDYVELGCPQILTNKDNFVGQENVPS